MSKDSILRSFYIGDIGTQVTPAGTAAPPVPAPGPSGSYEDDEEDEYEDEGFEDDGTPRD